MADAPQAERTEEATPRKRESAREEGRVPRSQELTVAVLLLGSALILNTAGVTLSRTIFHTSGELLAGAGTLAFDETGTTTLVRTIGWRMIAALGAFLAAMAGVSLAISTLQARGVMSLKPITPSLGKLNPLTNARRLVGLQALLELSKSLGKIGIVSAVVYAALRTAMPDALRLAQQPTLALLPLVRHYAVHLLLSAGLAYLALAGADYMWQWWSFQKELRMTKEEVKQEGKQQDGDPHVKHRRRQIARSYARRQMMKDVPRADVVIVNPTHIAIALKYDPSVAPAPVVLALGQRLVAERIKAIALENGVPVVQNKPVARALVKSAKVGTMIPVDLYLAVAEVLAYVLKTRGRRGSWAGSASA